jgi:hypothetical protein
MANNNSTYIRKESLNSDGQQQFHLYQKRKFKQ